MIVGGVTGGEYEMLSLGIINSDDCARGRHHGENSNNTNASRRAAAGLAGSFGLFACWPSIRMSAQSPYPSRFGQTGGSGDPFFGSADSPLEMTCNLFGI